MVAQSAKPLFKEVKGLMIDPRRGRKFIIYFGNQEFKGMYISSNTE